MRYLLVTALTALAGPALAEPPRQIVGHITETKTHKPVETATITVGDTHVVTNANGIYRVVVPSAGTYDVTITYADTSVRRLVEVDQIAALDATLDVDSDSVIVIHDPRPMVTSARPTNHNQHRIVPPYSDAAIEHDAWVKAWLLLDVDADGRVTRLKLLNDVGYDLQPIAVQQALAMTFEPARDAENRPMPALVLWSYEWPAYWWLVQMEGVTTGLTPQIFTAPCRGSGPLHMTSMHPVYRDCSLPDRQKALDAKWIAR